MITLQLVHPAEPRSVNQQRDADTDAERLAMDACEVIITDKLGLSGEATYILHDNATFLVYTGSVDREKRTLIVMPRLREMQTITNPELNHWCQQVVDVFRGKRSAQVRMQSGFPGAGGQLSTTRRAVLHPGSPKDPSNMGRR